MIKKLKKAFNYISKGDFSGLFRKIRTVIYKKYFTLLERHKDKKIGGIYLNGIKESKYKENGAYATQSTDYRCLKAIFKAFPLKENDVFVDVGCGEGRVLTYLYMQKFNGRLIGVELDSDVAATAKMRTKDCSNIEIFSKSILECEDIIKKATVFYLFNPFNGEILLQFVKKIEEVCEHPILLYYCNDLHKKQIDGRQGWSILQRKMIARRAASKMPYTVYSFKS